MRRFAVMFFAIVSGASFLPSQPSEAAIQEVYREPEARAWLKTLNPSDFFGGRCFLTFYEAERFVSRLCEAGALKIGVIFLAEEPQGFRVELPFDADRRVAVFEVANRILESAGFRLLHDTGQDEFVVWLRKDSYE